MYWVRAVGLGVAGLALALLLRSVVVDSNPTAVLGTSAERGATTTAGPAGASDRSRSDVEPLTPTVADVAVSRWATTPLAFLTATFSEVQAKMRVGAYDISTCSGLATAVDAALGWKPIPRADLESGWRRGLGLIYDGARLCVVELTALRAGNDIDASSAEFPQWLARGWPQVRAVLDEVDASMLVTGGPGLYDELKGRAPAADPAIVLPGDSPGVDQPAPDDSTVPSDRGDLAEPITRSGEGTAITDLFHVSAGDYSVEYVFEDGCFYSAMLEAAEGVSIYDMGSGAGPIEADTAIKVLKAGEYSVDVTADARTGCAWSVTLTPR